VLARRPWMKRGLRPRIPVTDDRLPLVPVDWRPLVPVSGRMVRLPLVALNRRPVVAVDWWTLVPVCGRLAGLPLVPVDWRRLGTALEVLISPGWVRVLTFGVGVPPWGGRIATRRTLVMRILPDRPFIGFRAAARCVPTRWINDALQWLTR
jgi:hypothetical protein